MEKIAEKRFHVIKPFLNKEKTLREIRNLNTFKSLNPPKPL